MKALTLSTCMFKVIVLENAGAVDCAAYGRTTRFVLDLAVKASADADQPCRLIIGLVYTIHVIP